LIPGLYFS